MGLLDYVSKNPGEVLGLVGEIGSAWSDDKGAYDKTLARREDTRNQVSKIQARGVVRELTKLPGDILKDPERLPIALHDIAKKYPKVDAEQFNSLVQAWQNTKLGYLNIQNAQAQENRTATDFATKERQRGEVENAADQYSRINNNMGVAQKLGGITGTVTDETGMPNDPRQTSSMISGGAQRDLGALMPKVAATGQAGAGLLKLMERGQTLPLDIKTAEMGIRKSEEDIKDKDSERKLREAQAGYYNRDKGKTGGTGEEKMSEIKAKAMRNFLNGNATPEELAIIGQGEDRYFRDALQVVMQSEEGMKLWRKSPEEGYQIIRQMADQIKRSALNQGPAVDPSEQKKDDIYTGVVSDVLKRNQPK